MTSPAISFSEGVYISNQTIEKFKEFEMHYLNIRQKEGKILNTEEIKLLPQVTKTNPDYAIWKLREKSINRFLKYSASKKTKLKILDIGCGNGFLSALLSKQGYKVIGLDVNITELRHAAEAFKDRSVEWYCLDILNEELPEKNFDMIVFCASLAYFKEPRELFTICKSLLKQQGEIHIIDSPFYSESAKYDARERSIKHFKILGSEKLADNYHHHSYSVLDTLNWQFKYQPTLLKKIFRIKDSPFPWIKISI